MADPVRIIIFQDNDEYTTFIHSDTPISIIQFSKGFYESTPENTVKINDQSWCISQEGLQTEDHLSTSDFDKIWKIGVDFVLNSSRAERQRKKDEISRQMDELQKKMNELDDEWTKLDEE
jgi:hypothetical protein